MTNRELRTFLAAADLRGLRKGCGFAQHTVALALGVSRERVGSWERREYEPRGPVAGRYARVVLGMKRHLEVKIITRDKGGNDDPHA